MNRVEETQAEVARFDAELPEAESTTVTDPGRDDSPGDIARPAMWHRWENLSFIHWSYPPDAVARLLPPGLAPHLFAGAAWVGLIPFRLRIRVPAAAPVLPWLSSFAEVNLRTYVRGPDGTTGIWFFSLEAARLIPVLTARAWYRLPYNWARTRLRTIEGATVYESSRRWPEPARAGVVAMVEAGPAIPLERLTALDRFLTARFCLWSRGLRGLAYTLVNHPPWPLRRARLRYIDEGLLRAAGLPAPEGSPLVHWSEGVEVRFGRRLAVAC
jgi:uncharacterized protein YqjF (DUF2071 family)